MRIDVGGIKAMCLKDSLLLSLAVFNLLACNMRVFWKVCQIKNIINIKFDIMKKKQRSKEEFDYSVFEKEAIRKLRSGEGLTGEKIKIVSLSSIRMNIWIFINTMIA